MRVTGLSMSQGQRVRRSAPSLLCSLRAWPVRPVARLGLSRSLGVLGCEQDVGATVEGARLGAGGDFVGKEPGPAVGV